MIKIRMWKFRKVRRSCMFGKPRHVLSFHFPLTRLFFSSPIVLPPRASRRSPDFKSGILQLFHQPAFRSSSHLPKGGLSHRAVLMHSGNKLMECSLVSFTATSIDSEVAEIPSLVTNVKEGHHEDISPQSLPEAFLAT